MSYEIKRVTACLFCRHFAKSERYGRWFCSLHNHAAEPDDRCTWGEEGEPCEERTEACRGSRTR